MAYSKNSVVLASDYNNFVGVAASATVDTVNTVWAVGQGDKGYGQTYLPQIAEDDTVGLAEWNALLNAIGVIALHQGTAITSVPYPVTDTTKITYNSAVPSNIQSIYANRKNLSYFSLFPDSSTLTSSANWTDQLTFTFQVSFDSGDKARYFFNCGGQLALSFACTTGSGVNALFSTLASACGTITMSGQSSGTVRINNNNYTGITKVGGSGTITSINTNAGYFGLTTTSESIFKQFAGGGPRPEYYIQSYIEVFARTSSPDGANGDNGNTITFTVVWNEVPNGIPVNPASVTLTAKYPNTGYIVNTWGTATITGSISGS